MCLCELEVSRRRLEPRDGTRWRGDKWVGEMEINNVICVRWRLTKQSQDVLPQSTLIMKTGLDKLALLWGEAQKKIAYSYLKVT